MIGDDNQRYYMLIEKEISNLIEWFKKYPYYFRTEEDVHCYLYCRLIQYPEFSELVQARNSTFTNILHHEFPSIDKGKGNTDEHKFRYDLVILDKSSLNEIINWNNFAGQDNTTIAPLIAIELGLNCGVGHLKADYMKLNNLKNNVNRGYIIHLMRDTSAKDEKLKFLKYWIQQYESDQKIKMFSSIIYTANLSILNKRRFERNRIQFESDANIWINYQPDQPSGVWTNNSPNLYQYLLQTNFGEQPPIS